MHETGDYKGGLQSRGLQPGYSNGRYRFWFPNHVLKKKYRKPLNVRGVEGYILSFCCTLFHVLTLMVINLILANEWHLRPINGLVCGLFAFSVNQ